MNPLAVFAIVCNCAAAAIWGWAVASRWGPFIGLVVGLAVFIGLMVIYACCAGAGMASEKERR